MQVNGGGRGPVSAEWMVPKALWMQQNEPELFESAAYVCEYQDFMNFHLTGRMVASVNNASIRWHYSTATGADAWHDIVDGACINALGLSYYFLKRT